LNVRGKGVASEKQNGEIFFKQVELIEILEGSKGLKMYM
jgi:hypothetical protein